MNTIPNRTGIVRSSRRMMNCVMDGGFDHGLERVDRGAGRATPQSMLLRCGCLEAEA